MLLVVGADVAAPFKRLAEQLGVGDRVIFAGARSDLPTIYPAADAFVFPTLYETFALVCLEAMASGLPVLASPVGGIEDYLRDGENGLHIQRDAADIAAKLDRLLSDRELYARLRNAGIATAQNYAWEEIAQQYLNLFDELIAERVQSPWVSSGPRWAGRSQSLAAPNPSTSV
jgi:glycosyltransferase involved in cell wall biosynthesis